MKKIIILTVLALTLAACNDDYLEKYPLTSLTEENAFEAYDNYKAYMYPCYGMFTNTSIFTSFSSYGAASHHIGDMYAGYLTRKGTSQYNPYAFQTITETTSGGGWSFEYIRRINIMLSHVDVSEALSQEEKDHWKAVGYFFHSFWYNMLINRFGDVPWIETALDDSSEEAYGPREDRKVVADKVLERLIWAENNIGDFDDGDNTINRDCVRALISRFALREGTWRKYHGLGDYDKYFTECARASELLMASYPTLYTGTDGQPAAGYGEMWTTENLDNVPGVILHKQYLENFIYNWGCHYEHTSSHNYEMPQHMVDMYLCKDGKPIGISPLYNGDKTMFNTFRNRDPRLYHTVIPPYTIAVGGANKPTGNANASWGYATDPAAREYIDIMNPNVSCSNPGVGMKRLPAQNWSATVVPHVPNFSAGSKLGTTKAFVSCRSGYYLWKHWCQWELNYNNGNTNVADKPIFKIEEVLLNYAECKWEQGAFNQTVANNSINKLRARAGVAAMTVADINEAFDPNRDQTVDPVLWEIRRERIIELMGEGFGFDDIRRWKKAEWFVNKQPYGQWTTKAVFNNSFLDMDSKLPTTAVSEGYIYLFEDPVSIGKGWLDKYYLFQVPTDEIVMNPALTQNPGW